MKRSKINFALTFVTTAVIVSVIGSVTGTLAWYAYATRATLSFSGTSAYASERLWVGIHDSNGYLFDNNEFDLEAYAEQKELTLDNDRKIIWGKEGEGLTGDIISTYLDASPYATSSLPPITSLSRDIDEKISTFYKAPLAMNTEHHEAPRNYYTKIPLCFKVLGSSDVDILANQDIWLTGVSAIDVDIEGLKYALRIYFENKYAISHADDNDNENIYNAHRYFLVNPTSELNHVGETVVAGTLDLKGDGTYDYQYDYNDGKYYEIVYGEYDQNTLAYSDAAYDTETQGDELADVNHTFATEASTFLAKHANNIFTAKLGDMTLYTAKYDTMSTIAPKTVDGHYQAWSGKPVAHTEDVEFTGNETEQEIINKKKGLIAYTDMTIYLEGWDHAIINKVISASFNLGLQFEVDHL